ncbi:diaminopimelate epimerase [Holospora obtusa F1]|uniref:diaminopimelate epimerase n=1 Tax=Holospora obtusa F1 TaxID=1399147 RepID=W6TDL2_HOLOB|nr:hypothetical protein [Holospora obtusa]ETZ07163.1 diaminopimelate epimerase [Holospora obtusa F1]
MPHRDPPLEDLTALSLFFLDKFSLDCKNIYLMRSQGNSFLIRVIGCEYQNEIFSLTQSVLECFFSVYTKHLVDQFVLLIYVKHSERWNIRFWNCDGSSAKACGNGTRCAAHLLYLLECSGSEMVFDGPIGELNTCVEKGEFEKKSCFVDVRQGKGRKLSLDFVRKKISKKKWEYFNRIGTHIGLVEFGNFHIIIVVDRDPVSCIEFYRKHFFESLEDCDCQDFFNISYLNFSSFRNANIATWERGVGPTPACGSAACAALMVLSEISPVSKILLNFPGGPIWVRYCPKFGYCHKAQSFYDLDISIP